MQDILNHPLFLIAKKEIMDNVRNRWIIIVTIIFAILTIAMSAFGSFISEGWQDLGITITLMMSIVQLLVPIIGLMLGYAAIIGEIEKGSMSALLSLPVTRLEVVIGKFLGLGGVLSFSIIVGFGIAGIVIGIMVPNVDFLEYLAFIGATILVGLVYLNVALFFSTLFKKRSSALGGAIFLWFFFNMILPIILLGIAAAGQAFGDIMQGNIPQWYFAVELINPMSVYVYLVTLSVGPIASAQGFLNLNLPSYYSPGLMVGILLLWISGFLALTFLKFKRIDL
jgi:Cu-processing system permease protein